MECSASGDAIFIEKDRVLDPDGPLQIEPIVTEISGLVGDLVCLEVIDVEMIIFSADSDLDLRG